VYSEPISIASPGIMRLLMQNTGALTTIFSFYSVRACAETSRCARAAATCACGV
jgi:hypothetical protein